MSDKRELSVAEEQALLLTQAAIAMSNLIEQPHRSLHAMAEVLERNVQIWVALKTITGMDGCSLPAEARANIGRLADFVMSRTTQGVEHISEETLRTFVNVNLQISEGLLEGAGIQ